MIASNILTVSQFSYILFCGHLLPNTIVLNLKQWAPKERFLFSFLPVNNFFRLINWKTSKNTNEKFSGFFIYYEVKTYWLLYNSYERALKVFLKFVFIFLQETAIHLRNFLLLFQMSQNNVLFRALSISNLCYNRSFWCCLSLIY